MGKVISFKVYKAYVASTIFTAVTLLATLNCLADDTSLCETMRLDGPTNSFSKIPIFDQNKNSKLETNLCYSVATAYLLDDYRFRNGDNLNRISSPISISVNYKTSKNRINEIFFFNKMSASENLTNYLLGEGSIKDAIEANQGIQICDQYKIENLAPLMSSASSINNKNSVETFFKKISGDLNLDVDSKNYLEGVKNNLNQICQNSILLNTLLPIEFNGNPGDYFVEYKELLKLLSDTHISNFDKKVLVIKFNDRFDKNKKYKLLISKIDELLNKKIPIGVGYFYRAIRAKNSLNSTGGHASVVIGRRKNLLTNSCEYLIRDSYGSNCMGSNGSSRYELPCENGSVWVDSNSLSENIISLTWIP